MDDTQISTVGAIAAIMTLLTQIIAIINNNFKEARNRRWAQEDKEELAKQTRHKLSETAQAIQLRFDELRSMSEAIKDAGEHRLREMLAKLEENTQISKVAFKEANGVNEKLHALGVQLKEAKESPQEVKVINQDPIDVHLTK